MESLDRKRSPFAKSTYVSTGDVRMSEIAIEQSTGDLNELMHGEWTFGQRTSVMYDISSRRLFVDTWDRYQSAANREMFSEYPAIARVSADIGGVAKMGYVANLSHIRSQHYRKFDLGLNDMSVDDVRLEHRATRTGAELLGGVVLREFGRLRYEGEREYEDQAAEFTDQLERFYAQLEADGKYAPIPGLARFKGHISLEPRQIEQSPTDERFVAPESFESTD